MPLKFCPCGSQERPRALYDGHGIYMCLVCDKCEARKMKGFRPDIMERYDTDEPIDAD